MSFEGPQASDYLMVERIASYAVDISFESDSAKRRVCINRAIALRDSGNKDALEDILKSYDWSACGLVFQVALAAVREQEDEFYKLLPRAVASEELKRQDLEEWPLFSPLRGTERFSQSIDQLFTRADDPAEPTNELDRSEPD